VGVLHSGLHIGHGTWLGHAFNSGFQGHTRLHVVGRVTKLHAMFGSVKHGGGHRKIARRSEAISHFTDVGVDPKNLLNHHHRPFGRPFGLGHIGGAFESIRGF
jgi:hypothetical protein